MEKNRSFTQYENDSEAYVSLGEYCLISAPTVNLPNGQPCVPQHFYGYDHCLESVEHLLNAIEFSKHYPIFCAEDEQGLFIQVGIIGRENYQKNIPDRSAKIVYGRKWRVEPNLPTSEIIQTVFLALKKAREHEIRELLTLRSADHQKISTPFNSHHDLPLMAQCRHSLSHTDATDEALPFTIGSVQRILDLLRFDQTQIQCLEVFHRRAGQVLIDVMFRCADANQSPDFTELHGIECTLILKRSCQNELLYKLMDTLIDLSDRYVEEHFTFNGFARFSRQHSIHAIGEFSINTRKIQEGKLNEHGRQLISEHNCSVDESRAPTIKSPQQKQRLRRSFEGISMLEGFLPKGMNESSHP